MAFTLDGQAMLYIAIGILAGLVLGWLLFRGAGKRAALEAELSETEGELAATRERNAILEREIASSRDQIKPLADEVDRLRAMKSPAKTNPSSTAAPVTPRTEQEGGIRPGMKIDTFLSAPHGEADDLQLIKGVGPKMEAHLNEMGIYHFAQIADWTPKEIKLVDAKLGTFKGRIQRDQLTEQAKLLAAGRVTEYEARFGKLGAPS
ncbi:hypothetical protein KCG44_01255 [Pacificimonas sp. WHA3]|uniref:Flap endonuclease-1-like 5' DNA nuclease n=1 Tax=Pacificimonas pallii TaxID=2827236 RepID=A0ABS6SAI3_9SPHN|nr:hypothetical protein [Pacificimonas pallii]MBV7255404.1 hypothetical protein [Pacificimonas pallii]